jgi:hypothetical protein
MWLHRVAITACLSCPIRFMTVTFSSRPADGSGLHRKKINISIVLAGQRLGIKEVDDGIWLVSTADLQSPPPL